VYILNKKIKKPLHVQLYESLKHDIILNYSIGEKIPSIRKVASNYNISKNTVENAFNQLVVEGYIDSYPKSGYIVTDTKTTNFPSNTKKKKENNLDSKNDSILYDFAPARLEKNSFPIKLWKRIFNKVINEQTDLGQYTNNQGEEALRIQITNYLNYSRALKCNKNQIVLGNGFADSMSLLAMILKDSKNSLAIEDPGYHVARKVFENHNYKIEKIKVDNQGINLDELKKAKSKLVYLTPSHQYPTGVAIPISNRIKLLQWAVEKDALIIEDDYDSELSFNNRPIPSLQGLDNNGRVIYIGTFSKALSPAIRVSYMVLPNNLS